MGKKLTVKDLRAEEKRRVAALQKAGEIKTRAPHAARAKPAAAKAKAKAK